MKDIQSFLKRGGNIEGTLINDHDEAWYLGPAVTIRPQKNNHYFKWNITGETPNVFPFNRLVIHIDNTVIDMIDIARGSYQEGKVVELHYGRT